MKKQRKKKRTRSKRWARVRYYPGKIGASELKRNKRANTDSPDSPLKVQLMVALLVVAIVILKFIDKTGLYLSGLKQRYLDLRYKHRVKTSKAWMRVVGIKLKFDITREKMIIWLLTKVINMAKRFDTTLADDENLSGQYYEMCKLGFKLRQAWINEKYCEVCSGTFLQACMTKITKRDELYRNFYTTDFDSDSEYVGFDSLASACMSPNKTHFDNYLHIVGTRCKGIEGPGLRVLGRGTLVLHFTAEDGITH